MCADSKNVTSLVKYWVTSSAIEAPPTHWRELRTGDCEKSEFIRWSRRQRVRSSGSSMTDFFCRNHPHRPSTASIRRCGSRPQNYLSNQVAEESSICNI